MSYRTPPHRRSAIQEVVTALQAAKRVVLTTHVNADGDGAGSEAALVSWIRARGGEAWIVNPSPFPDTFRFLLDHPDAVVDATTSHAQEICAQADLAVVVDTGEVGRIGRVKPLLENLPCVVIDHHPPGDQPIAGLWLRDTAASAAGELVHDLIDGAGGPWTSAARHGVYVAILTDTGGFRFSNTTASALRIAAESVESGVDPEAVQNRIYGSVRLRSLRLLREALATLDVGADGAVAWMTVPAEAYRELQADPSDLDGFIDVPRSIEGVEVALLFRTLDDGSTKVSLRANGGVDVNEVARTFGGGGHVKASGARLPVPAEEARDAVLARVFAAVESRGALTEGTVRTGQA